MKIELGFKPYFNEQVLELSGIHPKHKGALTRINMTLICDMWIQSTQMSIISILMYYNCKVIFLNQWMLQPCTVSLHLLAHKGDVDWHVTLCK